MPHFNGTAVPLSIRTPSAFAQVHCYSGSDLDGRLPMLESFLLKASEAPLSLHPAWLRVLEEGLGHTPYCLEYVEGSTVRGYLPLALVSSWLFGRFLVGLPYLNYGGVITSEEDVARRLIDRAVQLADELNVRYLELRHTEAIDHPAACHRLSTKVHMRLPLPNSSERLWEQLDSKVRNQVRKGQRNLSVHWGQQDLLDEFYGVFARNMRDLGTPVYGRRLFAAILQAFPDRAELCVVRMGEQAIAGALLLHGWGVTEVPSAGSLRAFNSTNANMLMYWHLLQRAVERGQSIFDFGRSTINSSTHQFKKQWGARPHAAEWQYYLRQGDIKAMRPDHPRYGMLIRMWKRIPVFLTRWLGPAIVRGIP